MNRYPFLTGKERILEALWPFIVPLDKLELDPANEREHPDQNRAAIRSSFELFGQQEPCLHEELLRDRVADLRRKAGVAPPADVERRRVVKVGNGRVTVAREMGWGGIASLPTDLHGAEAAAYRLVSNRTAELATWIAPRLVETLTEINKQGGDLMLYGFTPQQASVVGVDWDRTGARSAAQQEEFPEQYGIIIECESEVAQTEVLERLMNEGLRCRALVG